MKTGLISHLWKLCLDAFFPIECLGCRKMGVFLCAECLERIPEREYQECPHCRKPYSPNGSLCRDCRKAFAFDGLLIAAPYKNHLLDQAIHTYKYRFIESLSFPLARLIERALAHNTLPLPDLIIPVPLHERRLRFRGFNQSELLARELKRNLAPQLELPVVTDSLVRKRYTLPQMKTHSKEERVQNLAGAFSVPPEKIWGIAGRSIWLLDDVATTGTTLHECARALKAAGAKSVWGVVLAR